MLDEILSKINDSTNVQDSLKESMDISYFRNYMELAVSEVWPSIEIKDIVTKQYSYHRSMCGAFLLNRHTWNVISVIVNPQGKDSTKITQYKALSEMLYEGESKVLTAILTKDITSLYPNISFQDIFSTI